MSDPQQILQDTSSFQNNKPRSDIPGAVMAMAIVSIVVGVLCGLFYFANVMLIDAYRDKFDDENASPASAVDAHKSPYRTAPAMLHIMSASGLGVLQLVLVGAGICTLARLSRGERFYRIFIRFSFPLAFCGFAAGLWMIHDLYAGDDPKKFYRVMLRTSFGWMAWLAIGIASPIALCVLLRLKSVREFFDRVKSLETDSSQVK